MFSGRYGETVIPPPITSPNMRFLSRARTPEGTLATAKVQDARGRVFAFHHRFGITQFVDHPVSDRNGYGDGYYRTAGKRDAEAVRAFLEKWSQGETLARTTFVSDAATAQNARIQK